MSVIVRERERRFEEDVYRRPSPPRTLRSFRRYRVNRPFDEEAAYDDLYERERLFELDRRRYSGPYEVQSYSRSTEYFSRPQTIIVREEPETVIIRERRTPIIVPVREPEPVEDDIYYERDSRTGHRQEIVYEKETDNEPVDSPSQWSSDDDFLYIHRETTEGGFRNRSPHHGRHLAEGIVAGIGAEEIIRHHHKKEGRPDRHHKRNVAGAALAGAAGAEALSRIRSDSHHHHHHHHHHNAEDLAKLGLGTAAVAAAVNYGMNKNRHHRSRSRRRRHSVSGTRVYYDSSDSDDRSRSRSRSRHGGRHIAEAALGTAAAAGLIHHERNKSRRRSDSRSRSRHGSSRHRSRSPNHHKLPLAAAAVGTAALLAHHEKKKREHEDSDRRTRSRSRSRSVAYSDADLSSSPHDPGLIEYGDEPVYTNVAGDYSGHRQDSGLVAVPLAAGAGYVTGRTAMPEGSRSRSRTRRYERSPSYSRSPSPAGSDRRSRRRSGRHHDRHLAEAALAAGAAGLAAHEIRKKNHDRQKSKDHEQRHYTGNPYDERDYPEHPSTDYPGDPYDERHHREHPPADYPPSSYYPATNTFPPPPPNPYNPTDYASPPAPDVRDHVPPPPIPLPDPHTYGGEERVERIEEGPGNSVSDSASRVTSPEPPKSVTFDLRPHHRAHSYSPPPSIHSQRDESPSAASDSTIELPPRFDRQGRLIGDGRSGRGRDGYGNPREELAFRIGETVGRVVEQVFR